MFKPLLRTLPTLSGNYTIACKVNEFIQLNSNDYEVYIRDASLMPLQNNVFNKDIGLNLVKDQHEYVLSKYFYNYSNIFYKENYVYDKNNYREYDEYEVNRTNDSRNKDYEFGCKRLYYSQTGYQFSFYAPFYIDDVNDLPEYFIINIDVTNHLRKTIKIYINKDSYSNYIKTYLKKYIKNIDNRVIFCSPENKQATYFGIDVKNGGLVKYIDNVIGDLYNNQNTINGFDNTICKGFERNNLVMRQIIPLSFIFNINDLFNNNERKFYNLYEIKISGYYYNKFNIQQNFYDFSINYYNFYQKYLKYNKEIGTYSLDYSYIDNEKINIMNVSYPSLNEGRYTKYRFTNKITPTYCRFKLLYSDDSHPYITNASYGYTSIQNTNINYGEFPIILKDVSPIGIISNDSLMLPIGNNIHKYYDDTNFNKYETLMNNYYSSWFNVFNDEENIFENNNYWADIINLHSYFNGILFNLTNIINDDTTKFGIFINPSINIIDKNDVINNIINVKYVLSKDKIDNVNTIKMHNITYNDDYINKTVIGNYKIEASLNEYEESYALNVSNDSDIIFKIDNIYDYNQLEYQNILQNKNQYVNINVDNGELSYYPNIYSENVKKPSYLTLNKKIIKDTFGSYIIESNYNDLNKYYKYNDIINLLEDINENNRSNAEIINILNIVQKKLIEITIDGYELLPVYTYSNIFKRYNVGDSYYTKLIFDESEFNSIYDDIYIETSFLQGRTQLKEVKDILINTNYNSNNSDIKVYIKTKFISEENLFKIFENDTKLNINNVYWTNNDYSVSFFKELLVNENNEKMFELLTSPKYVTIIGDRYYNVVYNKETMTYDDIIKDYSYFTKEQICNIISTCETYLEEYYKEIHNNINNLSFSSYSKTINNYIHGNSVTENEKIIYNLVNIYLNLFYNFDTINIKNINYNLVNKIIIIVKEHIRLFESMLSTLYILNHNVITGKQLVDNKLENIYSVFYLKPQKNKDNEFYKIPFKHFIYKELSNLTLYSFYPYNTDKNILSYNYFAKNISIYDNYIYVDTYNLNKYIYQYNKNYNDNIPYIEQASKYNLKFFYYPIINQIHIKEYIKKLHYYNNLNITDKRSEDYEINILDHIYIKNRIFLVNTSTNNVDVKDEYILLKDYLFENYGDYEYIKCLQKLCTEWTTKNKVTYKITYTNDNGEIVEEDINEFINYNFKGYKNINEIFLNVICSYSRNSQNKFTLNLNKKTTIDLDLSFNKCFVQLNNDLSKLLEDKETYLYLYKCSNSDISNLDNWDVKSINYDEEDELIIIEDQINESDIKLKYYKQFTKNIKNNYQIQTLSKRVNINNYLVPLFSNIYVNDSDITNINNMINYKKIKDNKYIETDNIYVKQIDVNSYIRSYINYHNLQNIIDESLLELNIENGSIEDIENNETYYRNIFIKEKLGITLYKLYDNNIISLNKDIDKLFSKDLIDNYHIIYNSDNNLYFATDTHNKYVFYVINFEFDNTNNSFNLNNKFDISTSFNKINNDNISKYTVIKYFKNINPFLNTNIFKLFINSCLNNIIKPNNLTININYIPSKITYDEEYKYTNLKNSDNDIIYDKIVKYKNKKQMSILRYFNFITPLLEEKTILNDTWENLFITNDNLSHKHNILCRNNVNIYKYHPIHLCTKYDYVNNKELDYKDMYQNEYKHFNDNKFYNLNEEIIITLDDNLTYDELVNIYETEEKTIEIFKKHINNIVKKELNTNIILFLYNKYNVSYLTSSSKLNIHKNNKLYNISYKFTLK